MASCSFLSQGKYRVWISDWFDFSLSFSFFFSFNIAIADVGCGNGKYMKFLQDFPCYVIGSSIVFLSSFPPQLFQSSLHRPGSDISEKLVEICNNQNMGAIFASGFSLPFQCATFDITINIAVLHHISTFSRRRQVSSLCFFDIINDFFLLDGV